MKKIGIALGMILISEQVFAALPPNWQRVAEFVRIAQDHSVMDALGNRAIQSIRFIDEDRYEVVAENCTVSVALKTIPPGAHIVGPRQFTVKVTQASGCN